MIHFVVLHLIFVVMNNLETGTIIGITLGGLAMKHKKMYGGIRTKTILLPKKKISGLIFLQIP